MKALLFSLLSFLHLTSSCHLTSDEMAFKHFTKSGDQRYCMVNYTKKTISCEYKTMRDCREQYGKVRDAMICFPRKSLKLDNTKQSTEEDIDE